MTNELKRAMARYEEARVRYRKAVLASLDGASNGDAIRQAIRDFQLASAELKRVSPPPARPVPRLDPKPDAVPAEEPVATAFATVRRLVSGFGARLRIADSG